MKKKKLIYLRIPLRFTKINILSVFSAFRGSHQSLKVLDTLIFTSKLFYIETYIPNFYVLTLPSSQLILEP